jgi:hypothetical protein
MAGGLLLVYTAGLVMTVIIFSRGGFGTPCRALNRMEFHIKRVRENAVGGAAEATWPGFIPRL